MNEEENSCNKLIQINNNHRHYKNVIFTKYNVNIKQINLRVCEKEEKGQ